MNTKKILTFFLLAPLAGLLVNPAQAGNLKAGKDKAAACTACHEIDGSSQRPDAPHIGGQVEGYLYEQLSYYRNGRRKHPVMSIVAQDLSDQDIEDLAAWFSGIKVTRTPPE
ncbi:MAG: cytochrome c [Rhodospirillales bacterium]|nr:cytochrome c [Rhodospirillales bacterium]